MEMPKSRRKAVTYGRSSKRIPLYSVFDVGSETHDDLAPVDHPDYAAVREGATKKRSQHHMELQHGHNTSEYRYTARSSKDLSPSSIDASPDASDSSTSSQSSSHRLNESNTSSILDFLSSDEDVCAQQLRPSNSKRRKVTSLSKCVSSATRTKVPEWKPKTNRGSPRRMVASSNSDLRKYSQSMAVGNSKRSTSKNESLLSRPRQLLEADSSRQSNRTGLARLSTPPILASQTSHRAGNVALQKFRRNSHSTEVQDDLGMNGTVRPLTPQKPGLLSTDSNAADVAASPSQLELMSLHLNPEKNLGRNDLNRDNSCDPLRSDRGLTPRKARERLRDRLDAPRDRSRSTQTMGLTLPCRAASYVQNSADTQSPRENEFNGEQAGVRREAVSTGLPKQDLTRPRLTYAKERSHLSDMINEMDGLAAPEMPGLPDAPLLHLNAYNKLNSQLGQELYDSDDTAGAVPVKSIHELRQAGVNSRFEREIEAIFEDIDGSAGSSKALRIQALLQLLHKLEDQTFARQFIESGMTQRVAACSLSGMDLASAVLLARVLSVLATVDHSKIDMLQRSFEAVIRLSPALLQEDRIFHEIVIDRKENLSKATRRELVAFAKAATIWSTRAFLRITPQNMILCVLEQMLQRLRELSKALSPLPMPLFNQILALADDYCQSAWETDDEVQATDVALSILEYSALSQGMRNDDHAQETYDYQLLGTVVTRVMLNAKVQHPDIECIALRLVVSLTNNKKIGCDALAATPLIPTIFSVVENNLQALADCADGGDEFESSKLDTVIMALGCLLNFVDCSSDSRSRLKEPLNTGVSSIDWLVTVFNNRVGKAAEATTLGQSQVSVAFGYLSMLLCTLCIDDDIRGLVIEKVHGKTLAGLRIEAEDFLDKLQTVAKINPDEPATSKFNERFRTILIDLIHAEGDV